MVTATMRSILLRYLFIALVFAGTCFAGESEEEYFAVLMDGKKVGHGLQNRKVEKGLVTTTESMELTISRFGIVLNIKASETCKETLDGTPVSFETIENFSGNIKKTTGRVTGPGKMEITSHVAGSAQKRTVELGEDALMFEGIRLLEIERIV